MSRVRITEEELATWQMLFPQLVTYLQTHPGVGEEMIIKVAVATGTVSLARVKEWLQCTVDALYHDGTIIARDTVALITHMRVLAPEVLGAVADRVVKWAMTHPMDFMIQRAREEVQAEIDRWEDEPNMIENVEKITELQRLNDELERLG